MRKPLIALIAIVVVVLAWNYRYDLLFRFQYARLDTLSCQFSAADFLNDSCLQKLWAHRVNTVERYQILQGKLAGTETDIVWQSREKKFLVYHPPLQRGAVPLDSFLRQVNTDKALVWLDTRETPVYDTAAIGTELDRLDAVHRLKLNVIIEVYDTTVANYLAGRGYWIALNIHPEWLSGFSGQDWQQLRNSMSPAISFVSQEDRHVPALKQHFPGKDILTWSLSFGNYFNRKALKELLRDPQVKVVLVNIKSRHYR